MWSDTADYPPHDPVLHVEEIARFYIRPIAPEVRAGDRVAQLRRDAHGASRPPNAAEEDVTDAESAADLLRIRTLGAVAQCRAA